MCEDHTAEKKACITAENSSFTEQLVSLKSVWSRGTKMKTDFHDVTNYCQETRETVQTSGKVT